MSDHETEFEPVIRISELAEWITKRKSEMMDGKKPLTTHLVRSIAIGRLEAFNEMLDFIEGRVS